MSFIDQTCDPGLSTLRVLLSQYPGLVEFTKEAEMSPQVFAELPDEAFAWPGQRRFPIHTAEHAAISHAYTKVATDRIPADVLEALNHAVNVYKLDEGLFAQTKVAQAEVADDYLLPEARRYRVKTAEDVQLAESVFFEKLGLLSVEDRTTVAQNLVKKASRHGIELHEDVHKYACATLTSVDSLRDSLNARVEACRNVGASTQAQAFEKLSTYLGDRPPILDSKDDQLKLASLIHQLDKQAGLEPMYDRYLYDPLRAVFNTVLRREQFAKVGSVLEDKAKLQALPLSFWEDALGPDVVKEIAPDGTLDPELLEQVLPTLPADITALLQKQLASY